jgi:hypothetical protein
MAKQQNPEERERQLNTNREQIKKQLGIVAKKKSSQAVNQTGSRTKGDPRT